MKRPTVVCVARPCCHTPCLCPWAGSVCPSHLCCPPAAADFRQPCPRQAPRPRSSPPAADGLRQSGPRPGPRRAPSWTRGSGLSCGPPSPALPDAPGSARRQTPAAVHQERCGRPRPGECCPWSLHHRPQLVWLLPVGSELSGSVTGHLGPCCLLLVPARGEVVASAQGPGQAYSPGARVELVWLPSPLE